MFEYNLNINVKLSNSQLNKLRSRKKNRTEVTLKISLNVAGYSNDENSFHHKLLLTNTQVTKLCKTFADELSANVKYCCWKYKILTITQKLVKSKIKLLLIMTKVNILLLKNLIS